MIKAIIFDMDGVLVESEKEYMQRFEGVMKQLKIAYNPQDIYKVIGTTDIVTIQIIDTIAKGKMSGKEIFDLWVKDLRENPLNYNQIRTKNALELLQELKNKGYLIALASSTRLSEVVLAMKQSGLYEYFSCITSGQDCSHNKPHPEVYLKSMSCLNVKSDECIIVEDSKSGIEAGKQSGAYVVARKDKCFKIDQSKADESIDDLLELLDILERLKSV